MKKNIIFLLIVFIFLFISCEDEINKIDEINHTTLIKFDNSLGICDITIYNDPRVSDMDIIAKIFAGSSSKEIEWSQGISVFYIKYHVAFKELNGFTLDYIPQQGKEIIEARIDPGTTTNIRIPRIQDTVSEFDQLLFDDCFIIIDNKSDFSLRLEIGTTPLIPINFPGSSTINAKETVFYRINPGKNSLYNLFSGGWDIPFPVTPDIFEAGYAYRFIFNNDTLSYDLNFKLTLGNL